MQAEAGPLPHAPERVFTWSAARDTVLDAYRPPALPISFVYGAGRFLDTDPPKDGKVVLDFNKAYNPPCAFTPYATCPLPPPENRLPVRIEAGEKTYGH